MYVCVGVCARACVRAYVCVLSYTNVQVHTRDFSWAGMRTCSGVHVHILCECVCVRFCVCARVCTFVHVRKTNSLFLTSYF